MKKLLIFIPFMFLITACANNVFQEDYDKLKDDYEKLKLDYEELITDTKETKTCSFTKTYTLLQKLNYEDNDDTLGFVILSEFQSNGPAIARLQKIQIETMKIGSSYEFSFGGQIKEENVVDHISIIFDKFEVKSIKETLKIGLNQIQESITCK